MSITTVQRIGLACLRRVYRPDARPEASRLARRLLRMGEPAAALWWGAGDDVVLSRLGLHLSARALQAHRDAANDDRAQALERLRTAVALDLRDEALDLAAAVMADGAPIRSTCERLLASLEDIRVPDMLTRGTAWRAAAWLAHGDPARALAEIADRRPEAEPVDAVDLLTVRVGAWRRLARDGEARAGMLQLAAHQSLRPVVFEGAGIAGLHCPTTTSTCPTLVSVVMPVRNVAEHLHAALASVQRQDHHALQILVVDDASDDGTLAIAKRAAADDARIGIIRRGTQGGAYRARNDGLAQARGDFVTFHDGDDWSHPEKISIQLQALKAQPEAVACLSDWIRMRDDGSFVARQVFPLQRMNMSSLMFRRSPVWSRAGCFDPVTAGADSEYLARLRLLFGDRAVVRVRKLLSFASSRPESLMHDPSTGYASEHGRRQRLAYWEAWNRWHAESFGMRRPDRLRLGPDDRAFDVAESLSGDAGTTLANRPRTAT